LETRPFPDARSVSYTRVRLREDVGTVSYASRSGDDAFPKASEKTMIIDPNGHPEQ
jgi:hypothetical protein